MYSKDLRGVKTDHGERDFTFIAELEKPLIKIECGINWSLPFVSVDEFVRFANEVESMKDYVTALDTGCKQIKESAARKGE